MGIGLAAEPETDSRAAGAAGWLSANSVWPMLGVLVLWQIGAHIDAWYHVRYGDGLESFLTWPHAVLYTGWAATSGAALLALASSRGRPHAGVRVVIIGVACFGLGGLLDYVWHGAVGFETGVETILAPSHLWLLVCFVVAAVGTFQVAVAYRRRRAGFVADLAVMLCVASLFRATTWSLFYAAPLAVDYPALGTTVGRFSAYTGIAWDNVAATAAGTTGMLLHSVLLALFVLLAVRRLALPLGCIAVLMVWEGLLLAATTEMWLYLLSVAAAALVGEIYRWRLGGGAGVWLLASVLVVVQLLAYYWLMAAFGGGIGWSLPLWAGSIGLAGLLALVVSILTLPPRWLTQP